MTALDLMIRMERGGALAPSRAAWRAACHDEARTLSWYERAAFTWACDCRRCRAGLRKGGEYVRRTGEKYEPGEASCNTNG